MTLWRQIKNTLFTALCSGSVLFLAATLMIFLLPMLWKGSKAVFFRKTVEFDKMQKELFKRGHAEDLERRTAQTNQARQEALALLEHFSRGIDTALLSREVRSAYQQLGRHLRYLEVSDDEYARLREQAKDIRDAFLQALETTDKAEAESLLDTVDAQQTNPRFQNSPFEVVFSLSKQYRQILQEIDLSRRPEYAAELDIVKTEMRNLFGPLPGESIPPLPQDRFGATRWDVAQRHLQYLIYQTKWVPSGKDDKRLIPKQIRRDDPEEGIFGKTELAPLFSMVEQNLAAMLQPRPTIYWRYFLDDSTAGHYFGGVGPEVLGTLLLTVLSMCFAVPLGVLSAAYLVEYAAGGITTRIIRTCINTLAGVPSIVYGLFGLAFFVLLAGNPSILSASMTLALLVLPVIIRASEEAIRAVPQSYKEASLALGAGKFRTFLTVTLPAAGPGILTGIILSLSRAAGETAPILFAGAVALGPIPDIGLHLKWLFQPTRALSYGCYDITVGDRLAMQVPHNQFGMVMTLILLVLLLNLAAVLLRWRMSKKLQGL
ncbi:MAG TPA: phosphate ABC transporter permease PstA [Anaerohalosphaeraceae bacterium]|nr:phosphate ABC transporter permease PstA [Anaerohalosphaeraceae bacterium]HOL87940.1 phosphate ABC transporter permease PstA [Anaerohalosphaeraceae bacterium]HPP55439.1 phosphate ABC transporter permease PstA [Anaerohalosphaeraceae bacterium]